MARTSSPRASKPLRAPALRQDLYRILDRVAETGEPAVVVRKGRTFRISAAPPERDLSALPEVD